MPLDRAKLHKGFQTYLANAETASGKTYDDMALVLSKSGLKAHGAPELFAHFRGDLGLDEARQIAIDHTRQYAKRQMTWFRHQLSPDLVLDPSAGQGMEPPEKYLDKIEV